MEWIIQHLDNIALIIGVLLFLFRPQKKSTWSIIAIIIIFYVLFNLLNDRFPWHYSNADEMFIYYDSDSLISGEYTGKLYKGRPNDEYGKFTFLTVLESNKQQIDYYQGRFKNGAAEGFGTIYYLENNTNQYRLYKGNVFNFNRSGCGYILSESYDTLRGCWVEDTLIYDTSDTLDCIGCESFKTGN